MDLAVRVHRGGDSAPPVVLVHGSMDRGGAFARVVPLLGDRVVVRYDRRGYAGSIDAGTTDAAGHARDLLGVIAEHAGGRAVVVGHSLGGVLALVAASRGPDAVLAVGAFEPPMSWEPWWPEGTAGGNALAAAAAGDPGDAAEAFLRFMIGDDRWADLGASQQARRRAEGPALVAELRAVRGAGAPFDAAAVRCPVRTACGSETTPHHRRGVHDLARLLGDVAGPAVIDGARHGAHLTHPEAFAAWARSIPTGGS